ncbi:MAG: hypothetical protein IJK41_06135 [Muribaculaceae bacterium]|nr:hypothetical protein [Muribaculaceae bacterium]
MEINYYRDANAQGHDESWQSCQFTSDTDLTPFRSSDLVTINGQPYLRQHHITYLTGRETCRAHHFAKHLAIQILSKELSTPSTNGCKVLWIDTLNGPHISAPIFRELAQHATGKNDIHYICLDILGGQRDDHWWITRSIESLIKQLKPQLVVVDDMDHFMPYCGIRVAGEFNRVIRDAINHTDAAFLFIGYNHTGKKACTAGELGKHMFNSSNDIFSLSTVRDVTTVRHISGYDLHVLPDDSQFHFTIGPDNLPHETAKPGPKPASGIDDDTLRNIIDDIIQPGQDITPSDLLTQVRAQHSQLKRDTRDAALLDQIHRLHLLTPSSIPSGTPEGRASGTSHAPRVTAPAAVSAVRVNGDTIAVKGSPEGRNSGTSHAPCAPAPAVSAVRVNGDAIAVKGSPEGRNSGTSHTPSAPAPAVSAVRVNGDAIAVKGSPEGRDSGTSHTSNKVQGGSSPAPASQPALSAVRVNGDAIAVKGTAPSPSTLAFPCAAAERRSPQSREFNTSLTVPTHPQPVATCPVGGGSAAVTPQV